MKLFNPTKENKISNEYVYYHTYASDLSITINDKSTGKMYHFKDKYINYISFIIECLYQSKLYEYIIGLREFRPIMVSVPFSSDNNDNEGVVRFKISMNVYNAISILNSINLDDGVSQEEDIFHSCIRESLRYCNPSLYDKYIKSNYIGLNWYIEPTTNSMYNYYEIEKEITAIMFLDHDDINFYTDTGYVDNVIIQIYVDLDFFYRNNILYLLNSISVYDKIFLSSGTALLVMDKYSLSELIDILNTPKYVKSVSDDDLEILKMNLLEFQKRVKYIYINDVDTSNILEDSCEILSENEETIDTNNGEG